MIAAISCVVEWGGLQRGLPLPQPLWMARTAPPGTFKRPFLMVVAQEAQAYVMGEAPIDPAVAENRLGTLLICAMGNTNLGITPAPPPRIKTCTLFISF